MQPTDSKLRRAASCNKRKIRNVVHMKERTHPDNWPLQEVQTLEDLIADRAVTQSIRKEILHANYR